MANEIILTVTPKISVDELQKELEIALDKIANPTVKPTLSSKEFTDQLNTLSKSSETVFSSLDTLIGAAGQTMSSLTGNTVDFSGAIQTANGIVSAAQTAVTAVTSAVQLASAAQVIWNAAMSANPIAIVVIAVAALAAGVAALCAAQGEQISAEEQLAQANQALGEAYADTFSKIGNFNKEVENSRGILDALNNTTLSGTVEKQQELAGSMSEIQEQINGINRTASEERRELTISEIASLEELFEEMKSLADQQVEVSQIRQEAMLEEAQALAETQGLTAEQYQSMGADIVNSAIQTKEETIAAAKDAYDQKLALAIQEREDLGDLRGFEREEAYTYAQEKFQQERDQYAMEYQEAINAATQKCDATNAVIANGYASRAEGAQSWVDMVNEYNSMEILAEESKNDAMAAAQLEYDNILDKTVADKMAFEDTKAQIDEKYKNDLISIEQEKATAVQNASDDQIMALMDMVDAAGGQYDLLDSDTQKMVGTFVMELEKMAQGGGDQAKETLAKMNLAVTDGGKLMKINSEGNAEEFIKGWSDKDREAILAMQKTIAGMNRESKDKTYDAGRMGRILGGTASAEDLTNEIQSYYNRNPTYAVTYVKKVTLNGGGGYYASGGVTGYAKGGVNTANPKISKHAAGVFTKRTRLWDPITGINEYGEAGHEALLPLKESVFNEIARGIARQLSPAKLSGLMSQLKSAVQGEMSEISVQMTASSDYSQSSVKSDRMIDRLTGKMDAILDKLEGLASLSVLMHGQKVGKLVTATVNAGLNDIYSNSERSKF